MNRNEQIFDACIENANLNGAANVDAADRDILKAAVADSESTGKLLTDAIIDAAIDAGHEADFGIMLADLFCD